MKSTAEPLTYAEAIAALLALGPRLTWRDWTSHSHSQRVPDGDIYLIFHQKDGCFYAQRQLAQDNVSLGNTGHPTRSDAKMACERHYATGKWQ